MMTDSLFGAKPGARGSGRARGGLQRRRIMRAARQLAAACCAGLSVFAALACVIGTVATRPVVVASHDIARGSALDRDALQVVEVPSSAVLDGAIASLDELDEPLGGSVAQIDIAAGQPLFAPMVAATPVAPTGFTVVEVRLASLAGALRPGEEIALASAVGCAGSAPDGMEPADDAAAPGQAIGACVLVSRAVVMALPARGGMYGEFNGSGAAPGGSISSGGSGSDAYAADALVSLAMAPADALRVMASQEAGALLAVTGPSP